jgi:biopolymer transport protein ExbB
MNFKDMFAHMGGVAWTVIVLLVILSIYSMGVMIDRFRAFRAAHKESVAFLPEFVRHLKDNNVDAAMESSRRYKKSHIARVVSAGLLEFANRRDEPPSMAERVAEAIRRTLDISIALEGSDMKRGVPSLATIGSTAPFIGLFGTVFGIIDAFAGIASTGSGGLASVSAGIAEALITTAFGLVVAVPAVMAFNYFTGKLEKQNLEMNHASAELVDFFLRKAEVARAAR